MVAKGINMLQSQNF